MKYILTIIAVLTSALLLIPITTNAISDSATTSASVNINEFLSISLSGAPISFGNIEAGNSSIASTTLNVTIGKESNVININVSTKADDHHFAGPGLLAIGNMEYKTIGSYTPYTQTYQTACTGLISQSDCLIDHKLIIPNGTAAGSYTVPITFIAST